MRIPFPRQRRGPRSLIRSFAVRSGVAFVIVGTGLHLVVSSAVVGHFHDAAEFHAEFVARAVVGPLLAEFDLSADLPADEAGALGDDLRRYVVDDHVERVLVWRPDGTLVAADHPAGVGQRFPDRAGRLASALERTIATGSGTLSATPGPLDLEDPLRSLIALEHASPLVVEIIQDRGPTEVAARSFTRLLEVGLVAGLLLLWAVLLPITRRTANDLRRRARTDELTDLLNRSALEEQLRAVIASNGDDDGCMAVLFIDLDGFKAVNDAAGHAAGDDVLREVSARLREQVRPGDAIGRFAGDEFVVILDGLATPDVAEEIASRILAGLAVPIVEVAPHRLTASIGVSVARVADADPDQLIRDADAAMEYAKLRGGDAYQVFDERLRALVERRIWIDRELRGALDRGEFHLVFQPFVGLQAERSGRMVAVEALLRWTHPADGPVGPDEFIPIAERNGALRDFGPWIIEEACRTLAGWQRELPDDREMGVFVNLSPVQLTADLLERLDGCLAETGADPARLGFEITETAILDVEDPVVLETLRAIRARGCRVAVDDFGTGYSSLSRLRNLPMDLLKLDASFVHNLHTNSRTLAIATAVSTLARQLGIEVLAEGIETAEQLTQVRDLGFDLAQGYHLVRPTSADAIARLLAAPDGIGGAVPATVARPGCP